MDDLIALEQTLMSACARLATVLAQSPGEARTGALRAAAPDVFRHRPQYQQAIQTLRGPVMPGDAHQQLQFSTYRAGIWQAVEALVARQSWASSFPPLITRLDDLTRKRHGGMVNAAVQALFDLSNDAADPDARDRDKSYADIPLPGDLFVELLTTAQRLLLAQGHAGPMRFLDVGCGAGSKLVIANGAFEKVHGFDFNPAYVEKGRAFLQRCGLPDAGIQRADALDYDDYGAWDVIYFYRPLKDPTLAARMEARVLEQARPGAVIIAPMSLTIGRSNAAAARIEDPVYIAGATAEQARDLRKRAIGLGCERRPGTIHDENMLGFWAPVVLQSQANGFDLP